MSPVLGPEIYDDRYYRGEGADPLIDYESEYRNYEKTPRVHEFLDLYRLAERHMNAESAPRQSLRWLDFGCGAGGLLKFLRATQSIKVGTQNVPIDVSGHDVGSYADKLHFSDKLNILSRDDLAALPSGSFDVITCIEVIEHISEPGPVFDVLARLLAPRGLLLLTTGNLRSPLARLLGIRFSYCIPEIHVSYFSPASLRTEYARVGLDPVRVRFSGAIRFKFLKTVSKRLPSALSKSLAIFQPFRHLIDGLYGVSSMPSATKSSPPTIPKV